MKPTKKAKELPQISAARRKVTRQRLSLHDQAANAERTLYDAMAVAEAAMTFWEQSQKALKAAAGVSARERAEAVFDATKKFWEQSTNAVSDAQLALDAARDELIDYEDRRRTKAEAGIGLHKKVLSRMRERSHAVDVDIDDLSDEASAADMTFLNRWAEAYRALGKKK